MKPLENVPRCKEQETESRRPALQPSEDFPHPVQLQKPVHLATNRNPRHCAAESLSDEAGVGISHCSRVGSGRVGRQ